MPPPSAPTASDVRWQTHMCVSWVLNPDKKRALCRRFPHDGDAETVPLTFAPREDGGIDLGIGGLVTCGSWHSCLICGAKIAVVRAQDLEHAYRVVLAKGWTVVRATFTSRSHLGMSLESQVLGQRAAWEAVTSDRPWKADLAALGVVWLDTDIVTKRGKRRRVKVMFPTFESTVADEFGWHPHRHVDFVVQGPITREAARAALQPAWDRWCEGLAEHGMTAVAEVWNPKTGKLESAGFDVTVLDDGGLRDQAKYPFKMAMEAVGAVFKHGREEDDKGNPVGKRHRTPFEVMEHLALARGLGVDDELYRRDLAIVREWWRTAAKMRFRQCPWPPGLRDAMAQLARELGIEGPLLEKYREDEEIAADEVEGSETAGEIPRGQELLCVQQELDVVKCAGRDAGLTGVVELLDQRGIRFTLSATGVERIMHERKYPPPRLVVRALYGLPRRA